MAKKAITLPKGTLVYPKLNTPDEYKGKKNYKVNIKFPDADHRAVDKWLKDVAKDLGHPKAVLPWKKDKKNGELTLFAKSGEDKPPMFTDAKGREVPRYKVKVGGGTIARVGVSSKWYDVQGPDGAITLYITGIQIIDLKTYGGFEVKPEEGFSYYGSDEGEGEVGAPETPDTSEDNDDEDAPF